jgi:transcription factor CRZ1
MMASGQGMHQGGLQPQLQPMSMENGGFTLPQALLVQYPALQGLQWDNLGPGGPDEGDGRSSFDASSGGEFYDDEDPNGGYVSGPGTAYAAAWG